MAKLDTAERNALPARDFAGKNRTYPDEDAGHARAALSRAAANASPGEDASIRAKVAAKYPGMEIAHHSGRPHAHHPGRGAAHHPGNGTTHDYAGGGSAFE